MLAAVVTAVAPPTTIHVLEGHRDHVFSVVSCISGGRVVLASASQDTTIRLWDVKERSLLRVLEGHEGAVQAVATCAVDGRVLVVSGARDKTVRVWDIETGAEVKVLRGHSSDVLTVAPCTFHGRACALSAGQDRRIRLWDVEEGVSLKEFEGHEGSVRALATCAVGGRALMVSGAEDYTVRLWDVETGSMLKVLKGHLDYVSAVATCMAVGLGDADVTGGRVVILSGSDDKSVRLWEAETGTLLRVLAGHTDYVLGVATCMLDGRVVVVSGSCDKTVRLWSLVPQAHPQVHRSSSTVEHLRHGAQHGAQHGAKHGAQHRAQHGADAGDVFQVLKGHTDYVRSVTCCVAGGRVIVVSSSEDKTVRLWDVGVASEDAVSAGEEDYTQAPSTHKTSNPSKIDQGIRLYHAARDGKFEEALELLSSGANVHYRNPWDHFTPLLIGAYRGHARLVVLMLGKRASPMARARDGSTALHYAAGFGHTMVCEVLCEVLAHPAFHHARNVRGETPMDYAASNGRARAVHILSQTYGYKNERVARAQLVILLKRQVKVMHRHLQGSLAKRGQEASANKLVAQTSEGLRKPTGKAMTAGAAKPIDLTHDSAAAYKAQQKAVAFEKWIAEPEDVQSAEW
jgi:WD40 repeat protein